MKIKLKRTKCTVLLLVVSLVLIGCRKKSEASIMPFDVAETTTPQNSEIVETTEVAETQNEHIIEVDEEGNLWLSNDNHDDINITVPIEMDQETSDNISSTERIPTGSTEDTTADKQESTIPTQTEEQPLLPEETKSNTSDKNATPWG